MQLFSSWFYVKCPLKLYTYIYTYMKPRNRGQLQMGYKSIMLKKHWIEILWKILYSNIIFSHWIGKKFSKTMQEATHLDITGKNSDRKRTMNRDFGVPFFRKICWPRENMDPPPQKKLFPRPLRGSYIPLKFLSYYLLSRAIL